MLLRGKTSSLPLGEPLRYNPGVNARLFRILGGVLTATSFILTGKIPAQVLPATPGKFGTRTISGSGGSTSASVGLAPTKSQTTVRTTTYIALGDARQWKSSDGKSLLGKLIAF